MACAELDPAFDVAGVAAQEAVLQALDLLNAGLVPQAPLPIAEALASKQKQLARKLDTAHWDRQLAAALPWARTVLLRSEAELGARAFLAAVPRLLARMEGAVFLTELRHRLLVPDTAQDMWCPKCDGVMDRFSLHAGTCAAGGERTLRHNAVRNVLCTWADRAGLQPERERGGLLLPQRADELGLARRRPADIYLPCFRACQRMDSLTEAGRQGRRPIWTLQALVRGRASNSCPWRLKAQARGTQRRPECCGR